MDSNAHNEFDGNSNPVVANSSCDELALQIARIGHRLKSVSVFCRTKRQREQMLFPGCSDSNSLNPSEGRTEFVNQAEVGPTTQAFQKISGEDGVAVQIQTASERNTLDLPVTIANLDILFVIERGSYPFNFRSKNLLISLVTSRIYDVISLEAQAATIEINSKLSLLELYLLIAHSHGHHDHELSQATGLSEQTILLIFDNALAKMQATNRTHLKQLVASRGEMNNIFRSAAFR